MLSFPTLRTERVEVVGSHGILKAFGAFLARPLLSYQNDQLAVTSGP
jgi:hypothetical protein